MKPRFTDEQIVQMIKEQEAGKGTMVVARRLEPDPNRQVVIRQKQYKALEVCQCVRHGQTAAALLARDADQHFMSMLENIDGDQ